MGKMAYVITESTINKVDAGDIVSSFMPIKKEEVENKGDVFKVMKGDMMLFKGFIYGDYTGLEPLVISGLSFTDNEVFIKDEEGVFQLVKVPE